MKVIVITLSLLLCSCFTIPPKDGINVVYANISIPDPGCIPIHPLVKPIVYDTYTPRPQSIGDKYHYVKSCLINYSWGRSWTDKQDFNN